MENNREKKKRTENKQREKQRNGELILCEKQKATNNLFEGKIGGDEWKRKQRTAGK